MWLRDIASIAPYDLTPLPLIDWVPAEEGLKWFRIVTTTLLTVASRWVFVMSDVNYVSWHLHNVALLSALTGMWLVTMSNMATT